VIIADVSDGFEPHPGKYNPTIRSSNLALDIKLMKELVTRRDGRRTHRVSSDRAINAASRVFNTVEINESTYDDVITLLGDPADSQSSYRLPFFPPPDEIFLVYRFDSGQYGWEFVIIFRFGRVAEVRRNWIH
jgi:hypothetical protein